MKIRQIAITLLLFSGVFASSVAQTAQITGTITDPFDSPLGNVLVELTSMEGEQQSILTDSMGTYAFTAAIDNSYTLTCSFEGINPLNGVSTFDLVLGLQDIIHINPITNPYFRIAADVNNSGTVSVADLWKMRQLILGVDTAWDKPNWVFAPTSSNNIEATSPIQIVLSEDPQIIDFIGIKTGDINGNAY